MKPLGREIVVINWALWKCPYKAWEYIEEMIRIGLPCRIDNVSDKDWEILYKDLGDNIKRGEGNVSETFLVF